ncbi:MAG: hypothetical protein AAF198_00165 [Pseudomonadota bacterium]
MRQCFKALIFAAAVAGCTSGVPNDDGQIVEYIPTDLGIVECKLYISNIVILDNALISPSDVNLSLADDYCRSEGWYITRNGTDVRSSLPIPTGFPISRAEQEIWPKLTLAQQERALVFLLSGSTIHASLKSDDR